MVGARAAAGGAIENGRHRNGDDRAVACVELGARLGRGGRSEHVFPSDRGG